MSEEKLYAVKNDEGKYLLMDSTPGWDGKAGTAIKSRNLALAWAKDHSGHVVTFVEEPKKVVLSKEQAEIVEKANNYPYPARYILDYASYDSCVKEKSLMNAYVNGYTVAKEKKYLVYKELGGKQKNKLFAQAYRSSIYPGTISWILTNEVKSGSWARFTESEIEQYGLQDCEKEEVADDEQ
ncbi:DUF1642 domain-containing protein [Lacticaseibacillus paracasei]|uniref:DUF1642 domain-containing protein n=1 Tax=Lacticaseibacillus paracasei TaxID=1597 RepID=UPI0018A3F2B9|nr:DUF1642 domain-containing protein [Lacticaseibacillus paracasei]QOP49045.1 DUF1642 domain-containing protein [Lacticaseibacillus paracasei]